MAKFGHGVVLGLFHLQILRRLKRYRGTVIVIVINSDQISLPLALWVCFFFLRETVGVLVPGTRNACKQSLVGAWNRG